MRQAVLGAIRQQRKRSILAACAEAPGFGIWCRHDDDAPGTPPGVRVRGHSQEARSSAVSRAAERAYNRRVTAAHAAELNPVEAIWGVSDEKRGHQLVCQFDRSGHRLCAPLSQVHAAPPEPRWGVLARRRSRILMRQTFIDTSIGGYGVRQIEKALAASGRTLKELAVAYEAGSYRCAFYG